jgi:YspA, cpYpsA-related SLOG family
MSSVIKRKVLVCGGRDYTNICKVYDTLNSLSVYGQIVEVIEGGATGADAWAGNWAEQKKIKHTVFLADWEKHGKNAGPIRNRQMLEEGKPDLVIAFPGGKGTANMVKLAKDAGVQVHIVYDASKTPREAR